nr:glutaminyl-peptide cyclotransferase-like isoform X2 [Procambarus clarkii]
MDPKCPGFFFLLYAFLLFHSTLAEEKCDKRSPSVWYTAKETHEGIGLSDEQLQAISRMSDMKHFQSVLQPMLVPRVVGSENHANVRKHIVKTMRDLGWTVEESAFDDNTPFGQKRFTNIIANLNPNAPRHLVLACHYDSKIDREGTFIGATDSAVPCAMMLNLAKVMQANLDQHRQTCLKKKTKEITEKKRIRKPRCTKTMRQKLLMKFKMRMRIMGRNKEEDMHDVNVCNSTLVKHKGHTFIHNLSRITSMPRQPLQCFGKIRCCAKRGSTFKLTFVPTVVSTVQHL